MGLPSPHSPAFSGGEVLAHTDSLSGGVSNWQPAHSLVALGVAGADHPCRDHRAPLQFVHALSDDDLARSEALLDGDGLACARTHHDRAYLHRAVVLDHVDQ